MHVYMCYEKYDLKTVEFSYNTQAVEIQLHASWSGSIKRQASPKCKSKDRPVHNFLNKFNKSCDSVDFSSTNAFSFFTEVLQYAK